MLGSTQPKTKTNRIQATGPVFQTAVSTLSAADLPTKMKGILAVILKKTKYTVWFYPVRMTSLWCTQQE